MKDTNTMNKLIRKAGFVASQLVSLEEAIEQRMLAMVDNTSHPLHKTGDNLQSSFSNNLIQSHCSEEHWKLFIPIDTTFRYLNLTIIDWTELVIYRNNPAVLLQ